MIEFPITALTFSTWKLSQKYSDLSTGNESITYQKEKVC